MKLNISTYIPTNSVIHRLDARVKILLLAVYSVAVFFVNTWPGMVVYVAALLAAVLLSKIPLKRLLTLAPVVYWLAGLTLLFHLFVFLPPEQVEAIKQTSGLESMIYPLWGSFCFTVPGLLEGCYFAARILLLVFACLLVCFSTTSTELTDGLRKFLTPLRAVKVPVDDVAMVCSLAVRFIPVTAEEFVRIHNAQWLRGAHFSDGSLTQRLGAWTSVFIPAFVGLFRRADVLAQALDSRCYGLTTTRTYLNNSVMGLSGWITLVAGVLLLVLIAVFL